MSMIKQIINNRTTKNAGWLIGAKIVQMLISLFVGLLSARYLGPSNYGLINYASAYTVFFSSLCTLGINSLLVKEFVDNPAEEGKIIGTTLGLRAISSFLSAFIIVGIVSIVDMGEKTTLIVVAICSIGSIFHILETFNFWFQKRLQSKVTAMATLAAYVITCIYRLILIISGKNVIFFAWASSIDYICIGVFLLVVYRRNGGQKLNFSWCYAKKLLSRSHHFILSGLMISIYGQTDKLMLKQMLNTSEVGYYSTATTVCAMWTFVLSAIIDSLYPSIMKSNNNNEELFKKRNRQLYAIVFWVSAFVSICFIIFGGIVIKILYGQAYMPSVMPLKIITWYTAFSYLGVARDAWIVCKEKQRYLKYIYLSAAICNVILNSMLIPLWGATGAAFASLITQILTAIILPLFIKDLKENTILMLEAIFFKGVF